jgi:hypothetical protein
MITTWIILACITVGLLLIVLLAMSVGVMLGRRPISGSCGGIANQQDASGQVSCGLCSKPSENCKRLSEQMNSASH